MIDHRIQKDALPSEFTQKLYYVLSRILLTSEQNFLFNCDNFLYDRLDDILMPHQLLPLLHAASTCVQTGISLLPFYMQIDEFQKIFYQNNIPDLSLELDQIYAVYPELVSICYHDMMRIKPIQDYQVNLHSADSILFIKNQTHPVNVCLYDSELTMIPPDGGIDIDCLAQNQSIIFDDLTQFYFLGNITPRKAKLLKDLLRDKIIYGIAPCFQSDQKDFLTKRIEYYSKTLMAGSLSIYMPLLDKYYQVGISPISFYYLLYRYNHHKSLVQNTLSLLSSQPIDTKLMTDCNLSYRYIPPMSEAIFASDASGVHLDYLLFLQGLKNTYEKL